MNITSRALLIGGALLTLASSAVLAQQNPGGAPPSTWVPAKAGAIPPNAVVGGIHKNGAPMPMCRADMGDGIHPGKIWEGKCNVGWGGQEIKKDVFEVLVPGAPGASGQPPQPGTPPGPQGMPQKPMPPQTGGPGPNMPPQTGPGPNMPPQAGGPGIKVLRAAYGLNCNAGAKGDVTAHIAGACNGKPACSYKVDHTVIGDPAFGCRKEYRVEYACPGARAPMMAAAPPEASGKMVELKCQ